MQKKGISLIVLVITIIVMIILAATIIISLNNSNVIEKANKAVVDTDVATLKEGANMAWGEAYASGLRTRDDLKKYVEDYIEKSNLSVDGYAVKVTTKGVEIIKGWTFKKGSNNLQVTNGQNVINVADVVNYDASSKGKTGLTSTQWKILGASEGSILLISTLNVSTLGMGGTDGIVKIGGPYEVGFNGGVERLDEICTNYGEGIGAIGSRSIRIKDIDKLTGYDPKVEKYGEGTIEEYGSDIELHVYYCDNLTNRKRQSYSNLQEAYMYYKNGKWLRLSDRSDFITFITKYYEYDIKDIELKKQNVEVYNMLFGEEYWLATIGQRIEGGLSYGIYNLENGKLTIWPMIRNDKSYVLGANKGVRAVVSLEPTITLLDSGSSSWNISL